jgi:hypothetical protein
MIQHSEIIHKALADYRHKAITNIAALRNQVNDAEGRAVQIEVYAMRVANCDAAIEDLLQQQKAKEPNSQTIAEYMQEKQPLNN